MTKDEFLMAVKLKLGSDLQHASFMCFDDGYYDINGYLKYELKMAFFESESFRYVIKKIPYAQVLEKIQDFR